MAEHGEYIPDEAAKEITPKAFANSSLGQRPRE